jgi:hypothetical protein
MPVMGDDTRVYDLQELRYVRRRKIGCSVLLDPSEIDPVFRRCDPHAGFNPARALPIRNRDIEAAYLAPADAIISSAGSWQMRQRRSVHRRRRSAEVTQVRVLDVAATHGSSARP